MTTGTCASPKPTTRSAEASDVTVVFTLYRGALTGTCAVAYTGLALRCYLKEAPFRQYGLLNFLCSSGKAYNRKGERVKLGYIPQKGDVVVLA